MESPLVAAPLYDAGFVRSDSALRLKMLMLQRQIICGRATAVSSCACVEAQRPASSPPQCKFLQAFQNWILVSCEALEPDESLGSWLKTATKSCSMSCMWLWSSCPTGHVRDESSCMLTAAEFLLKMATQCNPTCS